MKRKKHFQKLNHKTKQKNTHTPCEWGARRKFSQQPTTNDFAPHRWFLCAATVVIQCAKRIKTHKITFAVAINLGATVFRFVLLCFALLRCWYKLNIGFGRIWFADNHPKRKSNYCFNKNFDRFSFAPVTFTRISTCSGCFLWPP